MARFRFRRLPSLAILILAFAGAAVFGDGEQWKAPAIDNNDLEQHEFAVTDLDWSSLFHHDYSPPSPPPPPPRPPSVSCEGDLGGVGSLDTTCQITNDLNLTRDVYIAGKGNFNILPGVKFHCEIYGCVVTINVTGNFTLGANSSIVTGAFELESENAEFGNSSVVDTTGMAGNPPPQTSGTPAGEDGGGGGHGGRGASCLTDTSKLPEDVWGGDAYAWDTLQNPQSFGSKGGSTSATVDYGGLGGGIVKLMVHQVLEMNARVLADGASGGNKGGGGSGGSIYIKAHRM
ncbi:hypothetical protein PIB30_117021 [Stylosanthes scabra]|uniref:Uncharacterized protein n=1 Tax=Stylosanthes scabra TaxID=79078 RepID=A0ABU6X4J0_9FABA|nr:hypothetical protein [Stylosanthes scabra]